MFCASSILMMPLVSLVLTVMFCIAASKRVTVTSHLRAFTQSVYHNINPVEMVRQVQKRSCLRYKYISILHATARNACERCRAWKAFVQLLPQALHMTSGVCAAEQQRAAVCQQKTIHLQHRKAGVNHHQAMLLIKQAATPCSARQHTAMTEPAIGSARLTECKAGTVSECLHSGARVL